LKIKNGALELLETSQALKDLFKTKDIPIEASFRLAELAYQLKGPVEIYIAEKQKLVNRFADKNKKDKLLIENGKYVITKNKEYFVNEYQKLMDIEINIEKPTIRLGQWAQGRINATEIRELSALINFTFQENNK